MSGTVNRLTAAALVQRVGQQLARAPHVVVDLGEVTVADPRDLAALFRLPRQARANGTQLSIARAEREGVLRVTGLGQMFSLVPTAEAVIAGLPRPVASRTESSQSQ